MAAGALRLFVFARHGESTANAANVLSGDPSGPVALTARGRAQARSLGAQLANLHIDLAVGTRLLRTQQTIDIALDGRRVPTLIEPGFDELRPAISKARKSRPTGPGGTTTPQATASPTARASTMRCSATRARYAASWRGKKQSRSSSSTNSHCDTSSRPPKPAHRPSPARPSGTQFPICLTSAPPGGLPPASTR